MKDIVLIKPKKGSREFATMGSIEKHRETQDGEDEYTGVWEGERFPDSKPGIRPTWDNNKHEWRHGDLTLDEVEKLAKKCRLRYKDDDQGKINQLITTADPKDFLDPFYNHMGLMRNMNEGEIMLEKDQPRDRIIYNGIKGDPHYETGSEDNPVLSARTRYVIVDKEATKVKRRKEREIENKARDLIRNMSDKKRVKVALILDSIASIEVDSDVVEDVLYDVIDVKESSRRKRQKFMDVAELPTSKLDLKYHIALAISKGIIRSKKDNYELFGQSIAKTRADLESFLFNEDNSEMRDRMFKAVNERVNG